MSSKEWEGELKWFATGRCCHLSRTEHLRLKKGRYILTAAVTVKEILEEIAMEQQARQAGFPHSWTNTEGFCRVRKGTGPTSPPPTDTLICLTELVLTLNNFFLNSFYFLQTKRVPMGTDVHLSYACLFVGYVEQSLFCCYTGTIPHLFLRYIEDCIGAASCSHEELEQFINFTNNFHRNFKFTWTISDTSVPFLDLSEFTWTSSNLVYCIRYSQCGLLYVGETKCRLGDRFVEHLRVVSLLNLLPQKEVEAKTLNDFKKKLDAVLKAKGIKEYGEK
eukprot:g38672.t1